MLAQLGHGAGVQLALMGLAHGPGLQLTGGVAAGVEIVVPGDLGKGGAMAPPVALVQVGPGGELTLGTGLAGRIGGQGKQNHGGTVAERDSPSLPPFRSG